MRYFAQKRSNLLFYYIQRPLDLHQSVGLVILFRWISWILFKLFCFGSPFKAWQDAFIVRAAAAAAKSLQSCPTLCDPINGSPPGSATPGILQARTMEWVAISFSNVWKWSHSVVSDSSRTHGLQPTRLLRPWDFPGKGTGVGCHCLLRRVRAYVLMRAFFCYCGPNVVRCGCRQMGFWCAVWVC